MSAAVDRDAHPGLFPSRLRHWLEAVVTMGFGNRFSPERFVHEKALLPPDELMDPDRGVRIRERLRSVLAKARERLVGGFVPSDEDRRLYEEGCLCFLLDLHGAALVPFIDAKPGPPDAAVEADANATPSTMRPIAMLVRNVVTGNTTWDEIERQVVAGVFKKTKSRREGARLLDMDRERFTRRLREALGEATTRKDSEKAGT